MTNLNTIRNILIGIKSEHDLSPDEERAVNSTTFILGMLETMMVSVEAEVKDFDYLIQKENK